MEVIVAKTAGFCFGVERAVDKVYQQIKKTDEPIYTYGPIIHNEEVVKDLEEKGVKVIYSEEELRSIKSGVIVIRSHGVSRAIYDLIRDKGLGLVDATCPFVKKIHKIVEKETKAGHQVVIVGDARHPEVEGIKGWGDAHTIVIGTDEEAAAFTPEEGKKVVVVAQTTFNYNKFQELVEIIQKKGYNVNVVNTICNATEERQTEAREIASEADVMIVIGGAHSSNTRKLYEICSKECAQTCFIQSLVDLELELSESVRLVGITAGASTPNNIIREVQSYVRNEF